MMDARSQNSPALGRRAISEALAYIVENGARLVLGGVVGIFVARFLGPKGFGLLSFAVSVFALATPLAALGMRSILVREFSTTPDWRPLLSSSLSRQLPVAVASASGAAVVVMASRSFDGDVVMLAFALFPLPVLALADTYKALLEVQSRSRRIIAAGLMAAFVGNIVKISAILMGWPLWVFGAAVTLEVGLFAVGLFSSHLRIGSFSTLRSHYSKELAQRLIGESWPLLLAAIAVTLYMKVDVAMLGLMAGDTETGVYVAAARLSEFWYFVPVAAAAAIRPRLARLYRNGNHHAYGLMTQRFLSLAFMVAVFGSAVVWLGAETLVPLLYGTAFDGAIGVLRVHVLAAPFVFLGVASSQWFIDRGLTKTVLARTSTSAALNVVLNLILIPRIGGLGAAYATLASYAVAAVLTNSVSPNTRPLFRMQMKALYGAWH